MHVVTHPGAVCVLALGGGAGLLNLKAARLLIEHADPAGKGGANLHYSIIGLWNFK